MRACAVLVLILGISLPVFASRDCVDYIDMRLGAQMEQVLGKFRFYPDATVAFEKNIVSDQGRMVDEFLRVKARITIQLAEQFGKSANEVIVPESILREVSKRVRLSSSTRPGMDFSVGFRSGPYSDQVFDFGTVLGDTGPVQVIAYSDAQSHLSKIEVKQDGKTATHLFTTRGNECVPPRVFN